MIPAALWRPLYFLEDGVDAEHLLPLAGNILVARTIPARAEGTSRAVPAVTSRDANTIGLYPYTSDLRSNRFTSCGIVWRLIHSGIAMTTLENIQARIAKLQAQAEALVTSKSIVVLEKIRSLMDKHGVTVADIEAHIGAKRRGRKPVVKAAGSVSNAKYQDPKTGATWSGHGRAPSWIASAKNREKFLFDGASANVAAVSKKPARAGHYVRGPQPPKYRDPKTGATWSGRGPAPAWLKGVKNRAKFLIAADTKAEATVATTSNKARKKASSTAAAPARKGQPKGKQAPKYRNPETGATWSGRGPAPAWLAAERDRSKFLVDGAAA
jgi:DNA-binding protein H-NS